MPRPKRPSPRPPLRGEVHLVTLDPTRGSEVRKTRPCVVVSPDPLNRRLRTAVVVPLTTHGRPAPFRVDCEFAGASGRALLDQIRTVDRARLVKRLGVLSDDVIRDIFDGLQLMFAP